MISGTYRRQSFKNEAEPEVIAIYCDLETRSIVKVYAPERRHVKNRAELTPGQVYQVCGKTQYGYSLITYGIRCGMPFRE